jgi:hypothetical protein
MCSLGYKTVKYPGGKRIRVLWALPIFEYVRSVDSFDSFRANLT